jgi:hypothetical protein
MPRGAATTWRSCARIERRCELRKELAIEMEMVSVTMDFGRADAALLDMVAAHLDAAIGSGKYDALFRAQ